jgi:hypothetical protein
MHVIAASHYPPPPPPPRLPLFFTNGDFSYAVYYCPIKDFLFGIQDAAMYQHGDSVHAAVLYVPLLHSLPQERHCRRFAIPCRQGDLCEVHGFEPVFRIRVHRIHMFSGLPDPDP